MKILKWFIAVSFFVMLMIVLLFTTVEVITFDKGYYEKEMNKYNIAQNVEMNSDDLLNLINQIFLYLKDKRKNIDIISNINGNNVKVFSLQEKMHMDDVKRLFHNGYLIRNVSFIILIILLTFTIGVKKNLKKYLIKSIQIGSTFVLSLIFFNNDLWLLDPNKSILINIVPQSFFFDTVVYIMIIFIVELISLLIIFSNISRHLKKNI